MNSFEQYYKTQAGSNIVRYSGFRYQKGEGFFGRLVTETLLPLLKKSLGFLGKNAFQAGVNVGSDLLLQNNFKKETIKELAKKRGLEQSKAMAKQMLKSLSNDQAGSGRRRKRKRTLKKVSHKVKKRNKKLIKRERNKRRGRRKKVERANDFLV